MTNITQYNKSCSVALWEGDSKWTVTEDGNISVCSLKKLCISYIAENLGDVCRVVALNKRIQCVRDSKGDDIRGKDSKKTLGFDGGGVACHTSDTYFDLVEQLSNGRMVSTFKSVDSNQLSSRIGIGGAHQHHLPQFNAHTELIPCSIFNVTNYGKIYTKTDSTDVPGDDTVIEEAFTKTPFSFEFWAPNSFLSPHVSQMLLEELDRCGIINNSTLSLFQGHQTSLHQVVIKRCGRSLDPDGLRFLQWHKLHKLEIHNLNMGVKHFFENLSAWTLENLRILSLPGYNPIAQKVGMNYELTNYLSNFVSKLKNLQELDLSYCHVLSSETLKNILPHLPKLWRLNISHCKQVTTIEPLMAVSDQLEHLSLAGVMIQSTTVTISVLRTLAKLRYLDVSTTANLELIHEECINEVLVDPKFAQDLEFIDVSNQTEVTQQVLRNFLETHSKVKCVGLINVPLCADFDVSKWPGVQFLRDVVYEDKASTITALNDCLEHYRQWHHLLLKVIKQVIVVTTHVREPQPQLVMNILRCAETHQGVHQIQVAISECLYNLTVGRLGPALHPSLLRSVVYTTIHSMTSYKFSPPLQKFALLLLCCDSVLHHVPFNQYWVALMALQSLHSYTDERVNLMAVGILSILAAKLTSEQTAKLGSNPMFMLELLNLVRKRIEDRNPDITLQFTLSALWNLTDESPVTCDIFLHQEGLNLFLNLLLTFPDNTAVETKVLGLFNNVAEVPRLRKDLLKPPFIAMLRRQLKSAHIAVSYFAAGISAHLVCAEKKAWAEVEELSYTELLNELGQAVMNWESPIEEMVAYKSFQPFLPLLHATDMPYVQLWAMWALHHVTVNNRKYYCPMLIREGIPDLLQRLQDDAVSTASYVSEKAGELLELVNFYVNVESKVPLESDLPPVPGRK